jgi:hypothetical protein
LFRELPSHYGFKKYLTQDDETGEIYYDSEFVTHYQLDLQKTRINDINYILDQLTELVYRETYLDTLSSIRDIKNKAEEILELEYKSEKDLEKLLESFNTLWQMIQELDKLKSSLSLPREIYQRVDSEIKETESKLVKS